MQVFMKILWSLSLQSMQLPLTGWYRVLSYKTGRESAGQPNSSSNSSNEKVEDVTSQLLTDLLVFLLGAQPDAGQPSL